MELLDLPRGSRHWRTALPVLAQLRPRLTPSMLDEVLEEGAPQGLRFLGAFEGDECLAVAGWRIIVNTSVGRKLYVDDLVTSEQARSRGIGGRLLEEIKDRARSAACVAVDLDSGVQRHDAHRFYAREGMIINAHHFSISLT